MLIEMLIAASCVSGQYNEACKKAMEAGTKQSGIYQNVDQVEKVGTQEVTKKATDTVGTAPVAVAGVAVKTVHDKAITYSVKPSNVLSIDQITTKVGQGSSGKNGSINFEWRF